MNSAPDHQLEDLPLKMIETLIEQIHTESIPEPELIGRLEQIKIAIEKRFGCAETHTIIEQAIERAPWLTSDAERLKQLQATLAQTIDLCCFQVTDLKPTELRISLIDNLGDLCELFIETESAQEEVLHAGFPGPEWAN